MPERPENYFPNPDEPKETREQNRENEKRYVLPEENIVELQGESELIKKLPRALKELPWPEELQGGGHTYPEKKEFKLWYPGGDVFLSMAVAVHELGHLRQAEIDEKFDPKNLPNDHFQEHYTANLAREEDANTRGLKRAQKYCKDFMDDLEKKFQAAKVGGKLSEFKNFEDVYQYFVTMSLTINSYYRDFGIDQEKKMRQDIKGKNVNLSEEELDERLREAAGGYVAGEIRKNDAVNKFFQDTDALRIGEKVDTDFSRKFLKQAALGIAQEKY